MDIDILKGIKKFPKFFKFRTFQNELLRFDLLEQIAGIKSPVVPRYVILFWVSFIISAISTFFISKTGIQREAVYMSGIFIFSGLLWVTEALPLFATSMVIIAMEIILLANPGGWSGLGFDSGISPDYKSFLSPLANPIIVLFFGGFLLAQATVKEGIDKVLASLILKMFGSKPSMILLGLMIITAIFSMWISNTATAAMMIALAVPIVNQIDKKDPFRKAILLSIPFAANIGGVGTPIASPPNAVALGFLKKTGFDISFIKWILITMPVMLLMLFFTWIVLLKLFKPLSKKIELSINDEKVDRRGLFVILIFITTVALWLTEGLHGLPAAIVAMLPAVAFTATGMLTRSDLNHLEWHILILIMGGLALGTGLELTGLDKILVSIIPLNQKFFVIVIVISTILFSTFMSNTAAANLILPIGITSAITIMPGNNSVIYIGISIALAASMAMSLPISTPPNTIAYAKGELESRDFIIPGIIIASAGVLLIVFLSKTLVNMWI